MYRPWKYEQSCQGLLALLKTAGTFPHHRDHYPHSLLCEEARAFMTLVAIRPRAQVMLAYLLCAFDDAMQCISYNFNPQSSPPQ
jgi:hypothetical protein